MLVFKKSAKIVFLFELIATLSMTAPEVSIFVTAITFEKSPVKANSLIDIPAIVISPKEVDVIIS